MPAGRPKLTDEQNEKVFKQSKLRIKEINNLLNKLVNTKEIKALRSEKDRLQRASASRRSKIKEYKFALIK